MFFQSKGTHDHARPDVKISRKQPRQRSPLDADVDALGTAQLGAPGTAGSAQSTYITSGNYILKKVVKKRKHFEIEGPKVSLTSRSLYFFSINTLVLFLLEIERADFFWHG